MCCVFLLSRRYGTMCRSADRVKKTKHVAKTMTAVSNTNRGLNAGSRDRPNLLGRRIMLLVSRRLGEFGANCERSLVLGDQEVVAAQASEGKRGKSWALGVDSRYALRGRETSAMYSGQTATICCDPNSQLAGSTWSGLASDAQRRLCTRKWFGSA